MLSNFHLIKDEEDMAVSEEEEEEDCHVDSSLPVISGSVFPKFIPLFIRNFNSELYTQAVIVYNSPTDDAEVRDTLT